mgnify:CR=1 FL=1
MATDEGIGGRSESERIGFRGLVVWQRSKKLAVEIYRVARSGPLTKDFSLRDQLQRSAVSICSNIAEGWERDALGDSIRFLQIAKGSSAELATQIEIAGEIGYLEAPAVETFIRECTEISRMLGGLIRTRLARLNRKSSR